MSDERIKVRGDKKHNLTKQKKKRKRKRKKSIGLKATMTNVVLLHIVCPVLTIDLKEKNIIQQMDQTDQFQIFI